MSDPNLTQSTDETPWTDNTSPDAPHVAPPDEVWVEHEPAQPTNPSLIDRIRSAPRAVLLLWAPVVVALPALLAVIVWQQFTGGDPSTAEAPREAAPEQTPSSQDDGPGGSGDPVAPRADSDKVIVTTTVRNAPNGMPEPADPAARYEGPGADIANNAGLSDPNVLRSSKSLNVTQDGAVIENLDVVGVINVQANNVTIRNVRVTTTSAAAGIKVADDFYGTLVEHAEVNSVSTAPNGTAAGIGGDGDYHGKHSTKPGDNVTVRNCFIYGHSDGMKAVNFGLYEGNYTRVYKLPDSPMHIDGIQGSGVSNVVVRGNFFDQMIAPGQNASIFFQAFTGKRDIPITNILVENNVVSGGTSPIKVSDGKKTTGNIGEIIVNNNVFIGEWRYTPVSTQGQLSGNLGTLHATGQPATTGSHKDS